MLICYNSLSIYALSDLKTQRLPTFAHLSEAMGNNSSSKAKSSALGISSSPRDAAEVSHGEKVPTNHCPKASERVSFLETAVLELLESYLRYVITLYYRI